MKKLFYLAILIIGTLTQFEARTQGVAINNDNTAPDASAMLDVNSANKGLLIPRVGLTGTLDATTIPTPTTSLLIYNNATAGTSPNNVTPGYYYWNGSSWNKLSVTANGAGTTNYVTKWNSSGNLSNTILFENGTNVGIGTTTPGAKLDIIGNIRAGTSANNAMMGTHTAYGSGYTAWWADSYDYSLLTDGINTYLNSPLASGLLLFRIGNSNKMVISGTDGNVSISNDIPNASAQLDVVSTTKGFLPPRMTTAQRDVITTPAEGLMIYNTILKKPSFYTGTEWRNFDGSFAYTIGDAYQGGIIAYILQPGDPGYIADQTHGLIATASDQSTGAEWGCSGTEIPGADGTALGTGNQNTINIMAGCATAGIAARLCGDLALNGYSDWYLPSKDELDKLYINRVAVGGFASVIYWSSSEVSNTTAWFQNFTNGFQGSYYKGWLEFRVRAVRAF